MVLHVQMIEWDKNQSITSSWKTIWNSGTIENYKAKFYNAIWQVNSTYIQVRLTYNSEVSFNLDLDELVNDYKLSIPQVPANEFMLCEYHSGLWILRPPEPFFVNIGSNIMIEMKSNNVDKIYNLSRGISIWGQP